MIALDPTQNVKLPRDMLNVSAGTFDSFFWARTGSDTPTSVVLSVLLEVLLSFVPEVFPVPLSPVPPPSVPPVSPVFPPVSAVVSATHEKADTDTVVYVMWPSGHASQTSMLPGSVL